MSLQFSARYPGPCAVGCEVAIEPGDAVCWAEGGVAHAHCPEAADPLAAEREPCPDCHTVPAVNGACDCEGES